MEPQLDSDGIIGKIFGGNNSVVRGGYSRIYGRLNGVDLVLVPLLGTGLIQPVQCRLAFSTGACGRTVTAATAFRIGTDGNTAPIPAASPTLPQPDFPGVNDVSAATGEALDPNFRPNVVDSFDLTIQRQITPKILVEFGYIGRRITHEYQPLNINAVPYMMTEGGQTFASAYAAVETQWVACKARISAGAAGKAAIVAGLAPQPFFETALAGTGYCSFRYLHGHGCEQRIQQLRNSTGMEPVVCLGQGRYRRRSWRHEPSGFNFPRTMLNTPINSSAFGSNGQLTSGVGVNASVGYGNYNGAFVSLKINNWHGVTASRISRSARRWAPVPLCRPPANTLQTMRTTSSNMYGPQGFDHKFVYNLLAVYEPPFYKGQQGLRARSRWLEHRSNLYRRQRLSPLLQHSRGGDAQAFGSADGANFFTNEQCVPTTPVGSGSASVHNAGGDPNSPNLFSNPAANYANFRAPILGIDGRDYGVGPTYGLPYWNMDLSIRKNIRVTERFSAEFQFLCLNTLNHMVFANPYQQLGDLGDWGALTSQGNTPRQMEFGIRIKF